MTDRETRIIRVAEQMARGSSLNNGVQWAAGILLNLLDGKNDCPACEGDERSGGESCFQCGGIGTLDGMVQVREKRASKETDSE